MGNSASLSFCILIQGSQKQEAMQIIELRCNGLDGHFFSVLLVTLPSFCFSVGVYYSQERKEKHSNMFSWKDCVRIWSNKKAWTKSVFHNNLYSSPTAAASHSLSEFIFVLCSDEPVISFVFHHILGGRHWIPGGSDHVPAHWNHGATEEPLWKTSGRLDGISVRMASCHWYWCL